MSSGLTGFISSDLVHESKTDFAATFDEFTRRDASWLVGARVGLRDSDGAWGASFFVRNLFDNAYPFMLADPLTGFNGGQGSSYITRPSIDDRRTYGVTVDFKF